MSGNGGVGGGAILLGALAGGLGALALREAVGSAPRLASWLSSTMEPLVRAGREGYAPDEAERRRLSLLGGGTIFVFVLFIAGPGPLALAGLAGPALATSAIAKRDRRYRRSVDRQVPEVATAIADAVSAGRSVRGALALAGSSLEGPPAAELARVAVDLELGSSTSSALDGLCRRLGSQRIDAFATALRSQQLAGGDISALMRRFASAAADQDQVADDARAATAQARFTGLLVVALPAGAGLFAELMQPGSVAQVIGDPAGVMLLTAAGALQVAGFFAIRRLGGATA